jgi:hypothetical protein
MKKFTDMDRRDFIKTTGLGAVAGWTLAPWPSFGFAEEATPEERAKRLAGLMDEHRLFDRGTRRVYRDKHLTGISLPVGGIAAGPIQINGEARRHIWQIFRNYPPVTLPRLYGCADWSVKSLAANCGGVAAVPYSVG